MKLTTFKFGNNAVLRTSLIAFSSLALLTACGGSGGGSSNDSQVTDTTGNGGTGNGGTGGTGSSGNGGNGGGSTTFNIDGTLSGLAANTEIVLIAKNNGVEKTLTLNSNSSFAFADQFNGNTDLAITKIDNPAFTTVDNAAANVQVCNFSNGKREVTIANSNAATVNISCAVKMIYPVIFNKNDSIRKLLVTSSTASRGNNNSNGTNSVFETNTANSQQMYDKVFAENGKAFFIEDVVSGYSAYSNLHETDGSVAGTKLVSNYVTDIKILNNKVFYTAITDTEQGLLKTYDGVNPSAPVESFKKTAFLETNIENTLAFTAEYPVSGGSSLSGL